jgi:TatD DNase family protein
MVLVDTHCHLDFTAFEHDRLDVLQRAQRAGLYRIINPGIDIDNCRTILRLCETHSELYAAVGVHPNSALTWNQQTLDQLRQMAQHPRVVAIGEIGLDFYHDLAPKDTQLSIFRQQLDLAGELGLPVIVHSRQAELDVVNILVDWAAQRNARYSPSGVLHSYGGDETTAQRAISAGFLVGITGPVTFRNAAPLQKLVANLPLASLLVETDSPFLAPHPHRGERNEPAYTRLIAEKVAALKNVSFEQVFSITTANAERLFQWSKV